MGKSLISKDSADSAGIYLSAGANPITQVEWAPAETAPTREENWSWSRIFLAYAPDYSKTSFSCQRRYDGGFYDLEATDRYGDPTQVTSTDNMLWADMPVPPA